MNPNSDSSRTRGHEVEDTSKSPPDDSEDKASPPQKDGAASARSGSASKDDLGPLPGSQQQGPRRSDAPSMGQHQYPAHHGVARLPVGPPGYYQPMHPPPPQGPPGEHGGYQHPPPRGFENAPPHPYHHVGPPPQYPPYMLPVPPPGYYMPPYGMYPPPSYHGHPMYGPPHPQGPHHPAHQPHPYGYPPPHHDPNMPRYPEHMGHEGMGGYPPPYGPPPPMASGGTLPHRGGMDEDDRKPAASRGSAESSRSREGSDDETEEDDAGNIVPGAVTSRLKTYIKPRTPSTQDVLDRRARKNAQSRARAARLRKRIGEIELKPEDDRTEEEVHLWTQYEERRQKKNNRSRERALEKKEEIDRILAKVDKKRSKIEKQFLETALSAKKRKNEGDRLRRQRLKELGLSTKGTGVRPGISARGPLPAHYQHLQPHHAGYSHMMHPSQHHNMGEIPMSPLPSMPHHHPHHMQSPAFGTPSMMNMGFHSPSHARGTPGRHHASMPYMPPPHGYDPQNPSPHRGHPHHVEQRRHADGSMSFSIDGRGTSGRGRSRADPPPGRRTGVRSESMELLMDHEGSVHNDESNASVDGQASPKNEE